MPSLPARIVLFLSSYALLMFIFALRLWEKNRVAAGTVAGVGIVSAGLLAFFVWRARQLVTLRVTVDSVTSKDAEAMSYIVSYVIPFIDLPFDEWKNAASLVVFFIMLGVIYINTNMIHIKSLEQIQQHVPIANFDDFAGSCRGHLQKLGKLKNIATRPYLRDVTMADLKRTIKEFDLKGVKVVRRGRQEMLEFDPGSRWEILKLLDDDYLGSVMTKLKYEVNSKRVKD